MGSCVQNVMEYMNRFRAFLSRRVAKYDSVSDLKNSDRSL